MPADKRGVPFVIVMGDSEVATDDAEIKSMKTGDEIPIKLSAEMIFSKINSTSVMN